MSSGNAQFASTSISGATSPPGGTPTQASVSVPAVTAMNLGTSLAIPVTIHSVNGYAGNVALAIDNKVLAANNPAPSATATASDIANTQITVSVVPSSVTLTAGGTATASVNVWAPIGAPDLTSYVNLVTTTSAGTSSTQVPIQVVATFEEDIDSQPGTGGAETWTTPGVTPGTTPVPGTSPSPIPVGSVLKFTQHTGGVTLNFVDKDPSVTATNGKNHRIHSDGQAFLHEGEGGTNGNTDGESLGIMGATTPVTVDNPSTSTFPATTTGGTYTAIVTLQTANLSNGYYCHAHESPTETRTMTFNAYTTPPKIGASGNPNATFSKYIQPQIMEVSCKTCHITLNPPDGGVNMSTYADLIASPGAVVPGNAASSSLYSSLANGSMPLSPTTGLPTPLPSPTVMIQAIQDWINDGAPNN